MIAKMINAVTVIFGRAMRKRRMEFVDVERDNPLMPAAAGIQFSALGPRFRGDERTPRLDLEALDLVPQRAVLALVGGPDLLLRDLAELLEFGLDHDHSEGLKLRLCLGEVVDRLGCLADLVLRLARNVEQQLSLLVGEAVPDF